LSLLVRGDDEVAAVRADFDGSVQVGSVDLCAVILEAGDRRRRWVTVVVVGADADHGNSWLQYVEQLVGRGGRRAVMCHLQDVYVSAEVLGQTTRNQLWIDVLLHVTGEQHPP
jgi:hypothetical protein